MSVAVITGAVSGLGRCFAESCAKRRYNLLLADLDGPGLEKQGEQLEQEYGCSVRYVEGDLRSQSVRNRLLDEAVAWGNTSLWINNAGVSVKGPASRMDAARATMVADLNVTALTDLATRAIPLLLQGSGGRMINVSSLGAWYPIPYMAAYASSKTYILHFSMALNRELAGSGVSVSALCPGGMKTNELTIRDLEGQGLFGRLTIHSPAKVAELAIEKSASGRDIIIPGKWNAFLRNFGSLFSKAFLARNLERRWRKSLVSTGLMGED